MRPLYVIAKEIQKDWLKPNFGAVPYLKAMFYLSGINDMYYSDSAREIVIRFLCNAGTWRGETARRIKKELKELI